MTSTGTLRVSPIRHRSMCQYGFSVQTRIADSIGFLGRFGLQQGRRFKGHVDLTRLLHVQPTRRDTLFCRFANPQSVDREVQNVTHPVATVAASVLQARDPVLKVQWLVLIQVDVDASKPTRSP